MSGWQPARLGDLLLKTGTVDPTKAPSKPFTYIDVSSVSNVSFSVEETQELLGRDAPSRARRQVEAGDVIFATVRPTLQRVAIIPEHLNGAVCSTGYFVLRAGPKLDRSYLFYWLFSHEFRSEMEARQRGASYPAVTDGDIREQVIPLPPLDEQRRIVAVLDKAFAAIATATNNAEENLAHARDLFEQATSTLLIGGDDDWREYRFEEVCSISSKLVDPRQDKFADLPHIGAGNMDSRTGEVSNVLTAREEGLISGKFLFDPTMVLYSKIRPYLRKACRPDFAGLCSADVYPLAPEEDKLDRDFLFHILLSSDFTMYAEAGSARAGMPKVNRDHMFAYRLRLPPVEKQRELAKKIDVLADACRDLTSNLERKRKLLEDLKQSLLHRAFAGELRKTAVAVPSNDNYATPEFAAQVLAFSHVRHVALGRSANFGHVKAQKTLHAMEAIGGLDLGRQPIRDAAGPNDFSHMLQVETWAKQQRFFEFVPRSNGGYDFRQLENYDKLLDEAKNRIGQLAAAKRSIELLVDMDSDWAEIVVTTHAAWNNLILDQAAITDDAIVQAARDDWHPAKLRFDKSRFHDAIRFIRSNDIIPDGSGKRVGGQESLPL